MSYCLMISLLLIFSIVFLFFLLMMMCHSFCLCTTHTYTHAAYDTHTHTHDAYNDTHTHIRACIARMHVCFIIILMFLDHHLLRGTMCAYYILTFNTPLGGWRFETVIDIIMYVAPKKYLFNVS